MSPTYSIHVHIHIHIHVHIHVRLHIHLHVHTCICTCSRVPIQLCTLIHINFLLKKFIFLFLTLHCEVGEEINSHCDIITVYNKQEFKTYNQKDTIE